MSDSKGDKTPAIAMGAAALDFTNSGVVVVGGSSGVGLATAIAFAQSGASKLVIIGRDKERGKNALAQILAKSPGSSPQFISADVNDPAGAETAAAEALKRIGLIDILVNSTAAGYTPTLLHDTPIEHVPKILLEQALGPLLMSRAILPFMREQKHGSIVNISSDAARVPTPGETVLGSAMAAIVTFSRTLALEAKRYGVRVNVLTPSLIVNTGSHERVMEAGFSKKIFDKITAQAHLGLTEPEDLANAILFLSSPMARLITGQVISVNGGISVA